jgi:hypothetical protein
MNEWRSRTSHSGRTAGAINGTTKKQRAASIATAKAEAKEIVAFMETKGFNIPKDEYAREAIESVVEMVRRKEIAVKDKLAAARTLLEYTMAKPATEATVNVKKAEDFLADLTAEMNSK